MTEHRRARAVRVTAAPPDRQSPASARGTRGGRGAIPALTGVRALAAFLVFFHHHPTKLLTVGPLRLWREMHVGVTLFFVLSGLVITWRYDDPEDDRVHGLGQYFLNRFARIYPLYFVLVIPTLLLRHQTSPTMWFVNLTLIKGFSDAYKLAGIGQSWSLTVEECFYATAPLLFLVWRRSAWLALGIAAAVLAGLLAVASVPTVAAVFGPPRFVLLYTYFGRFFEFLVGVWLAHRLATHGLEPVSRVSRRLPLWTLTGAAGIVGVIFALSALGLGVPLQSYGLYRPAGIVLNNLVLPVFIAAFYWGLVREKTWLRRALSTRTFDLFGKASYAFYLIHAGPILIALTAALVSLSGALGKGFETVTRSFLGSVGGLFLLVLLLSISLYYAFERPRKLSHPPVGKSPAAETRPH